MKIELQNKIILIFLYDTLVYVYCIRSYEDMWKIWKKYNNKAYNIMILDLKDYKKIDRTILKLYDYHDEIEK